MLFRKAAWPGLADGSITVAFRWWKRPSVRAGGTLRTPAGVLSIDAVDIVDPEQLTEVDAERAGQRDLAALLADLGPGEPDRQLYRITFHWIGEDDRTRLREEDDLDAESLTALIARLARLDRAAPQPWTTATLGVIAERAGIVSTELATSLDMDRMKFKTNVRKLKALGLTESLEVGYRLSARGIAVLTAINTGDTTAATDAGG